MTNFIRDLQENKEFYIYIIVMGLSVWIMYYITTTHEIKKTHTQCIENNQQIRTYSKQVRGDTIYYVLDYDCFTYEIKHVEYKEFERDAYWSFEAFDKYGQRIENDFWESDFVLNLLKIDCQNIN